MLERRILSELRMGLDRQAAVALLGPRQAGKTTLALALAAERPAIYLDLERPGDLAKLGDPEAWVLNLPDREALLGHPAVGGSWEGFAIENLLRAAPAATVAGFYRSSGGAEVDLVLELPGGERWAVEIKRSATARPGRGFHSACDDLQPARRWLVHSGADRFPLGGGVEAIGLHELATKLAAR